jgi:hypothetical protein
MTPWLGLLAIVLLALVFVALPVGLAAAWRSWGVKVVRCPLRGQDASIEVTHAGLAEATGIRALRRVASCTLRRGPCGEECLRLPEEALREVRV